MHDFEAFQAALATHQGTTDDEGEPTYMNSLMNSMSLVLDEFYKHLKVGGRGLSCIGRSYPDHRRCCSSHIHANPSSRQWASPP